MLYIRYIYGTDSAHGAGANANVGSASSNPAGHAHLALRKPLRGRYNSVQAFPTYAGDGSLGVNWAENCTVRAGTIDADPLRQLSSLHPDVSLRASNTPYIRTN